MKNNSFKKKVPEREVLEKLFYEKHLHLVGDSSEGVSVEFLIRNRSGRLKSEFETQSPEALQINYQLDREIIVKVYNCPAEPMLCQYSAGGGLETYETTNIRVKRGNPWVKEAPHKSCRVFRFDVCNGSGTISRADHTCYRFFCLVQPEKGLQERLRKTETDIRHRIEVLEKELQRVREEIEIVQEKSVSLLQPSESCSRKRPREATTEPYSKKAKIEEERENSDFDCSFSFVETGVLSPTFFSSVDDSCSFGFTDSELTNSEWGCHFDRILNYVK